jgi:TolB-like protein/tetratricopeptide (TPR) repeat protein
LGISLERGFRLGAVEVRPAERTLRIEGSAVSIEPKSMDVLLALARSGRDIVSREELIRQVWPRGYVTDDALNRCISNLRSALGDTPRNARFIGTVPRRGYRLLQDVEALDGAAMPQGALVLPFQNLSEAMEEYVADGLTELLIARLSVALDQPVISRTTAMSFKGTQEALPSISRRLGVHWVIEGSLMQMGDQVQIVVQLIDADTDTHTWAETWIRPVGDLLSVLNEISALVATRVRSELHGAPAPAPTRQTLRPDLLRDYLLGIQLNGRRTRGSLSQAVTCFERVLASEPGHAPSLSGMAMSYFLLAHYGALDAAEGFGQARRLAESALALDSDLADARLHLAAVAFHHDWNFKQAEQSVKTALEMNPNLEMALVLSANIHLVRNRYEQAQACIARAMEIDPLNIGLLMNAGDHLILQRRFPEAIGVLHSALDIESRFRPGCLRLALAQACDGQPDAARASLERCLEMAGEDLFYLEYKAIVEGRCGRIATAVKAAEALQDKAERAGRELPWALARAWVSAQQPERAVAYLQRAFETRSSSMPFLGFTPVFDPIREHPQVREWVARIGR